MSYMHCHNHPQPCPQQLQPHACTPMRHRRPTPGTGLRMRRQAVNAANAPQLPLMLATKALPEMEAEDAGLLWAHRDAAGNAPVGAQYEQLGVRITRA